MARRTSQKYNCEEMVKIIEDYVDACLRKKKVPILKEVTVKMHWNYHWVMMLREKEGYEDFKEALDRLIDCKEYMVERLGQDGKIERTMAVFTLKQLGWTDNNAVNVNTSVDGLKIKLVTAE